MLLRTLIAGGIALYVVFLALTFIPSAQARAEAAAYFTEAEIATGLQHAFERRLLYWAASTVELALLCGLALTGASRRLADRLLAWTGGRPLAAVLGLGAVYFVAHTILQFPFALGRHYHTRAWGMTSRPVSDWFRDYVVALALTAGIGAILLAALYAMLRLVPRWWWALAALAAGLFGVVFAFLLPVVIAPLFNTFTPLTGTEWAAQEPRLRALVNAADVPVRDILVMDASRQSTHANAYFTGFGPTRSVVLYDNLLRKHPPAEVESILAHELGHWTHHHILQGLLLGTAAAFAGFWLLDRALREAVGRGPWHLTSLSDPAGLPLVLLLAALGSLAVLPAETAVSRHFETQADRAALELAGQPVAFIEAEKRLARENLGNVAPAPWSVWIFATHPPTVARIRMAEAYREGE
jgi:STE24 endopeptidase